MSFLLRKPVNAHRQDDYVHMKQPLIYISPPRSHCWGFGPTIRLTSDSAALLNKGIEISTLSKTFQHAITVTKRFWKEFGVRFLWIDSLCIVQDSVPDWRRESAIMGEIYQNAFCTIAATAAKNGDHGLFYGRGPSHVSSCAISITPVDGEKRHFRVVDTDEWARNVSKGPLNRRSWVFQERLLSPRIIHFANNQLYWECSGLEASEAFLRGFPDTSGDHFKALLPFAGTPNVGRREPKGRGPYRIWDHVMKAYSSGKLSRRTDKLVALSGVAHKLRRVVIPHDTYLAGLWWLDLPFELLWDVEEPPTLDVRTEYVAPSWSWASQDGTVPCEEEPWASADRLVDLISADVQPTGEDRAGQVSHGFIRLSGILVRGRLERTAVYGSQKPHMWLNIDNQPTRSVVCRPDVGLSSKFEIPHTVYCLPILHAESRLAGLPRRKGLLLVPTGRDTEFRRYGTFTADVYDDTFLFSSPQTVFETGILDYQGQFTFEIV